MARISVITPTYNNDDSLLMVYASLAAQSVQDWEWVLVDDGSRIPAAEVISGIADPRITVIRHAENRGRGAARQTGLERATGDLVAFQDGDDWSHPDRFAAQLQALAEGADFVGTEMFVVIGAKGMSISRPRPGRLNHATLMVRTEVARAVGYEPASADAEDYRFVLGLLDRFEPRSLPVPLYVYNADATFSLPHYAREQHTVWHVDKERLSGPARLARGLAIAGRVAAYGAARAVRLEKALLRSRYRAPTAAEVDSFTRAEGEIGARRDALGGPGPRKPRRSG
jgi:glycosyltransferase involved in cell wall biosynthesis